MARDEQDVMGNELWSVQEASSELLEELDAMRKRLQAEQSANAAADVELAREKQGRAEALAQANAAEARARRELPYRDPKP